MKRPSQASVTTWSVGMPAPRVLVFDLLAPGEDGTQRWLAATSELDEDGGWSPAKAAHLADATLELSPPERITANYSGGGVTTLDLFDDGRGGTDLRLTDVGQVGEDRTEVVAGWISVLLGLKASIDFSLDLRDHSRRTFWTSAYFEH